MAKRRKVVSKQKRREKQLNKYPKPQFSVGDLVQVKNGVMDYNWSDLPLGGWVGRIDKVQRTEDGPEYDVTWMPETLANAHPIYKMLADDEMLNPSEYEDLHEADVQMYQEGTPIILADPGDVTHYTDRPLSPDDFFDRLRMVFGLKALEEVLWQDDDGANERYLEYLVNNLTFPFEATFIDKDDHNTAFTCVELFIPKEAIDDESGIFCRGTDQNGQEVISPLAYITVKDHPQEELIDDYQEWCF